MIRIDEESFQETVKSIEGGFQVVQVDHESLSGIRVGEVKGKKREHFSLIPFDPGATDGFQRLVRRALDRLLEGSRQGERKSCAENTMQNKFPREKRKRPKRRERYDEKQDSMTKPTTTSSFHCSFGPASESS